MRSSRWSIVLALVVALGLGACSSGGSSDTIVRPVVALPTPTPYPETSGYSTSAAADLAVVWINNGCSGVLIGRRTIITAGHCETRIGSDAVFAQDRSVTIYYIGKVAEAVKMPAWDGAGTPDSLGTTGVRDLQLLRLKEPVPRSVTIDESPVELRPASISGSPLPAPCVDCIRHVGFGSVVYGQDNYRKKSIVSNMDSSTPFKFEYGTDSAGVHHGTCHGDSGGAGFMTFQGVEVLVGVVNNGDEKCERESWDIRMDRADVQEFVRSHLSTWGDCTGNANCTTSGRPNE